MEFNMNIAHITDEKEKQKKINEIKDELKKRGLVVRDIQIFSSAAEEEAYMKKKKRAKK